MPTIHVNQSVHINNLPPPRKAASLSIIIYKLVDSSEYRHTALFLESSDTTTLLLHITRARASGFFQAEVKPRKDPVKSKNFDEKIEVGKIQARGVMGWRRPCCV